MNLFKKVNFHPWISALSIPLAMTWTHPASASHDHLRPTHGPWNHRGVLHKTVRFISIQDLFESQNDWDREFKSSLTSSIHSLQFIHQRTLWLEQNHLTPQAKKARENPRTLLSLTPESPHQASILYSTLETNAQGTFQARLELKAWFLAGDAYSTRKERPYILQLTPESQVEWNHLLRERLALSIFRKLRERYEGSSKRNSVWVKNIRFTDLKVYDNVAAQKYWKNQSLVPSQMNSTFFFGDSTGIIVTHPDYELSYSISLTPHANLEIDWSSPPIEFIKLEPFVSIAL